MNDSNEWQIMKYMHTQKKKKNKSTKPKAVSFKKIKLMNL